MTSRERVIKALSHEKLDRVPVDLGAHGGSGMNKVAHRKLMDYLGFKDGDAPVMDLLQQYVDIDDRILEHFEIDTRPLWRKPPKNSPDEAFPDGRVKDEWGIVHRPAMGGIYYDVVEFPLRELKREDLDVYPWPDPHDPGRVEGLSKKAKHLHENTEFAIVSDFEGSLFTLAQLLRGFDQFCIDLMADEKFANKLLDKILEFWIGYAEKHFRAVGDYVDVVCLGDDLGTERAPWMSLDLYRRYIKPREKELCSFIRNRINPNAKLLLHSCGSVYQFMEDFIEVGIEALCPLQVSAADMDTKRLKRKFGSRMAFWGGIDTQKVLPYGSPKEVEKEVKRRIEDLAPQGGYVLAPVHNIQTGVPPENICTMFEAARKYGMSPIGT